MMEWADLCEQVAAFASTTLGRRRLSELKPAASLAESELLLAETQAARTIGG